MAIKCRHCGFDLNRDAARFCRQCGRPLAPAQALAPVGPGGLPAPGGPAAAGGAPPGGGPPAIGGLPAPGGPAAPAPPPGRGVLGWLQGILGRPVPDVEGRVLAVTGPSRVPLRQAQPAGMVWWFVDRDTVVDVRYLRVLDTRTGEQRSVKMVGVPSSDINVGDTVACWGWNAAGALNAKRVYNRTTGAEIRLTVTGAWWE